jgi:predicted GIY-YIG superfamily endonuclease
MCTRTDDRQLDFDSFFSLQNTYILCLMLGPGLLRLRFRNESLVNTKMNLTMDKTGNWLVRGVTTNTIKQQLKGLGAKWCYAKLGWFIPATINREVIESIILTEPAEAANGEPAEAANGEPAEAANGEPAEAANDCNIYILLCHGNKYYVGQTSRLPQRLLEHFSEKYASAWTTKYPPIRLIEQHLCQTSLDENFHTKRYMKLHGIDNVRGGSYVQVVLPEYKRLALEDELSTASGLCFRCHQPGHYISQCNADEWVCLDIAEVDEAAADGADLHVPWSWSTTISSVFRTLADALMQSIVDYNIPTICTRCGRSSHLVDSCYARRHIDGYYIR